MTNDETLQNEIESSFNKINTTLTTELERRCMTLCKRLGYTGRSLADAWEAHTLNHTSVNLNIKSFDFFQKQLLQRQQKPKPLQTTTTLNGAVLSRKKVKKEHHNSKPITPEKTKPNVILEDIDGEELNVFSNRKDSGAVINTYNPHSHTIPTSRSIVSCTVSSEQYDNNVTHNYRNLFTPMDARANALDEQLLHLSEQIAEKHNVEELLSPVQKSSPEEVCVFGRICNAAHEGKINATSILLEGSRDYSNGQRIQLKLGNIPSYSIFPGQVVAVKGYNPQGNAIAATEIFDGVPLPYAKSTKDELMTYQAKQNGEPLYIMTSSGPYTTKDNQDYEPFHDFLNFVQMNKPDAVILTGPFTVEDLDSEEEALGNRRFYLKIISLLEDVLEDDDELKTQFIIIPSLDDEAASPVYPQAPFYNGNTKSYPSLNLQTSTLYLSSNNNQIHCLSNPASFSINEVTFGVTSTDVLLHTSSEMIHVNNSVQNTNRMDCLVQHLLSQQSYYPLFPARKIPCDVTKWEKFGMVQSPDVLLVPSKLMSFCRRVKDTLVVNSGTLAKGKYGGTYANMWIYPMEKERLEQINNEDAIAHEVWNRSSVEVKKV